MSRFDSLKNEMDKEGSGVLLPILTVLTQIFEAGTRPAKEQDHGGGVWVQLDTPIPHLYLGQFEIIHFRNRRRFQLSF